MTRNLPQKALNLARFTVGYNILEGVVSIAFGVLAGSIALFGFGLDSFVESLSGGIILWRFRRHGSMTEHEERKTEERAVKLIGYTFFIFSAYVLYESVTKLFTGERPETSLPGIIIALISSIVMPVLYYEKYTTGKALNSKSLIADSKETLACVFLSLSLLAGLGLNYLFGLWWADPAVGIIIVLFLAHEGYETLFDDDDD